jgi:hypothetical protein
MTMQTIRKNATKKIQSYLDKSVGIIFNTSSMQIDDSFDYTDRLATAEDVISWLADSWNYRDARILLEDDKVLKIAGPYYFSDEFCVYLDQDLYDEAMGKKKLALPELKEDPKPLPANVVSLCAYRQRLAG